MAARYLSLVGWKSEVGRGPALRSLSLGSPRLWDRCLQAPTNALAKTRAWLAGDGGGVFPALLPRPRWWMTVALSPSPQFPRPALAPGRLCVGRTRVGGRRGNFKLSGQNVKFTHEFTQQKEGEEARAGTPHARVLSVCLSPPSSPTLLFSPRPKQA